MQGRRQILSQSVVERPPRCGSNRPAHNALVVRRWNEWLVAVMLVQVRPEIMSRTDVEHPRRCGRNRSSKHALGVHRSNEWLPHLSAISNVVVVLVQGSPEILCRTDLEHPLRCRNNRSTQYALGVQWSYESLPHLSAISNVVVVLVFDRHEILCRTAMEHSRCGSTRPVDMWIAQTRAQQKKNTDPGIAIFRSTLML